MLFCFGLFALLLYNTVVANAECSYTYRNSSQQHIEAQSWDLERQGFRRCEFLIELGSQQQQVQLNFTRLSGFSPHNASHHAGRGGQGSQKEEEEEEVPSGSNGTGVHNANEHKSSEHNSSEHKASEHYSSEKGSEYYSSDHDTSPVSEQSHTRATPSQHAHTLSPTTATISVGLGSKLSSILSSPTPPRDHPHPHPSTSTNTYAKSNGSWSHSVVETDSSSLRTTPRPGHDGHDASQESESGACLPMVEIRAVLREGEEETRHRICRQHHNTQTPIVFHYASSVRIVYEWKQKQNSGFTLYFDFNQQYGKCVHKCDGTRCLTERRQLCDGHADCRDRSDEGSLACHPSGSAPLDAGHWVQVVVIPTCVVVVVVVVLVVCLLARHRWSGVPSTTPSSSSTMHHHHHHHHHHHRGNGHAVHLDCPQSHSSEGLVSSVCSTQECSNEQAVALLPGSHHRSHKSWHPTHPPPTLPQPDPEIDLPPNIPVSPDGEEGYSSSQLRLLERRYRTAQSELFKAPPNKTVFDRESPPPYSLTPSSGSYGCGSPLGPPPSSPGGYGLPACPERVIRDSDGKPVVSRCYTMFSAPARPRSHLPGLSRLMEHGRRHRLLPPGADKSATPSSTARVHGACVVGDALHPSPPPACVGAAPLISLPSQTESRGWSQVSSGGLHPTHTDISGSEVSALHRGPPPSYQAVLGHGGRETRGGGEVRDSPMVTPVSLPSSPASSSSTSSTTTSIFNSNGDPSAV